MAKKHTFPQTGDQDEAENFAQLIGMDNLTNHVETGMSFTVDYTIPEVTINSGLAYIQKTSDTTSSTSETRLSTGYAVQLPSTTKSLVDNDINYIYIEPDLSTDDNATFQVYTNETNSSSTALKIGEIDTSNDTSTELNRNPDVSVDNLNVYGSNNIEHSSLVGITSSDHHTRYSSSEAQSDVWTVASSDWYDKANSGFVNDGDAGNVFQTTLQNGETLEITQAGLVKGDGTAVPSGCDLIIADLTNNVSESIIISGDGTIKTDVTGSPITSYQNSSGSTEQVAVLVDNGHFNSGTGSNLDIQANFIGRVV